MSTFGMAEALADAAVIRLGPDLRCRVASLPAQINLKLTAWRERGTAKPHHDSTDIKLLLTSYSGAWNVDRLYQHTELLEAFDFDADLAGAMLLGRDTSRLLGPSGAQRLEQLLTAGGGSEGRLAADMPGDHAENQALLDAFGRGLRQAVWPVQSMGALVDIEDKAVRYRILDDEDLG